MDDCIVVHNLVKSYGQKEVLRGVSFSVKAGETYALLGVNGAGKTTTIECIEGLRCPGGGSITVGGLDVREKLKDVQKILGVQLQSTSLTETITAKEAMQLFCAWHHVPYRGDLLKQFDMSGEYMNQTYGALSTGRKRRLHLALALCHNPKVLILDEPTAGLDVEGRHALHNELRKLKSRGVSILIATHDMSEAESLCDKIAILQGGQIVKEGSPMELTAAASIESKITIRTQRSCLKSANISGMEKPKVLDDNYLSFGCKDSADALLKILTTIQAQNDAVMDLRVERASIEELFLSVAGKEGV